MKQSEQVKRVKSFFRKKKIDSEIIRYVFDYSNDNKQYFVYTDIYRKGCFDGSGEFMSKDEVNEIIRNQFIASEWDNVIIFDVKKNAEVVLKIE